MCPAQAGMFNLGVRRWRARTGKARRSPAAAPPSAGVGGGLPAEMPCMLMSRWLPGASSCSSSVGSRQCAEKMYLLD